MTDTILKKGTHSDAVKEAQAALNRGGWLKEDGVYGEATELAVKAFQLSKALTEDGEIGPKTKAALGAPAP